MCVFEWKRLHMQRRHLQLNTYNDFANTPKVLEYQLQCQMYTRIHQYERTNTHTQTCNCIQLGLSIYAIESQNMHTNHICSATTANINDVWPHMKRQRENKKNNKKLKCCAGFFCFGQNVIHLPAAAARTAHKADLKASLLHSMTFNHFACVCVAHMNLL